MEINLSPLAITVIVDWWIEGEPTVPDLPVAAVRRVATLPLLIGRAKPVPARIHSFTGLLDEREHVLLALGPATDVPLVRVHSECLTGDVLGSLRCDCGPQLHESLQLVHRHGGAVVYLRQEGRGIGLYNKIDAYALQDGGMDTFDANEALGFPVDARRYAVAAQILLATGMNRINLLSRNPDKVDQLTAHGIEVMRVIGLSEHANPFNRAYLRAKADRHDGWRRGLVG
jgi:GTP cyclohydrolase II